MIAYAVAGAGGFAGLGEGRHQHRGENRDNGDNHEEFDQGEAGVVPTLFSVLVEQLMFQHFIPPLYWVEGTILLCYLYYNINCGFCQEE